jgi:mediator of replication checkpoint protein 1
LEKSAFVEAEAQESDEDEMFGFRKPDEGDEEDGEDQDRTLETLVDDKEMNQVEIAEERVMEKYK